MSAYLIVRTMASATDSSTNSPSQNLTLNMTGETPISLTFDDLNQWYLYSVYTCIEYSVQLGASLILFIALILLTKPDKRKSPVFVINSLALFLNGTKLILLCTFFASPLSEAYAVFAEDYSQVPASAYGASVAAEVGKILVLILVQLSLLLQTQVVCVTLRRVYRMTIAIVSSSVGLACIGYSIYEAVLNVEAILTANIATPDMLPQVQFIAAAVTSASFFWSSAVFVAKLAHALYNKRQLGLNWKGSMSIIFAGGCQTLILPAIFSAVQFLIQFPGMGSFAVTFVTLCLPMSSLWASSVADNRGHALALEPIHKGRQVTISPRAPSSLGSETLMSPKDGKGAGWYDVAV